MTRSSRGESATVASRETTGQKRFIHCESRSITRGSPQSNKQCRRSYFVVTSSTWHGRLFANPGGCLDGEMMPSFHILLGMNVRSSKSYWNSQSHGIAIF